MWLRAVEGAEITVPVSPNASFLQDSPLDVCFAGLTCDFAPTLVDLAGAGLAPGERVSMTASGWLCPFDTPDCTRYDASDRVLGVFVGPQGFLSSGAPQWVTGPTWIGGIATDIPEDFLLPLSVEIPQGATGIEFGVLDSAFGDNTGEIRVTIASEVPEPRWVTLVALGILASVLWWVRK